MTDPTIKAAPSGLFANLPVGRSSAVRVLMAKADNVPLIESQERIRIDIFMRDNLP